MIDGGAAKERGKARVVRPNREQLSWGLVDPEGWLEPDDKARLVWGFIETLDLGRLYDKVKAREGEPGRPPADPAVLLALWLLATIEGVGSARELDRLTECHLAYRWLCCEVPINYHGLADFRVAHADVLDELLTKSLAAFMAEGLVDADEIIVDGTKVRASAGTSSFKRAVRLEEAEAAAKQRVTQLKAEVDADPASSSKRRAAARERAARETQERVAKAKAALAAIEKEREERAKRSPQEVTEQKEPRASLTDPDARRMRFADEAIRAAYNVQLAATSDHGFITAVQTTDRRNDKRLARPMLEESERRTGRRVKRLLADTGYASVNDIAALGARPEHPVTVYVPPPPDKENSKPASVAKRERKRAREPEVVKA
jgi:transposase